MVIRSFLAFELPPEIKGAVNKALEDIGKIPVNVRWVNIDRIHLTVVFMGNIRPEDISPIGERVEAVCRRYNHFHIQVKGLGLFPDPGRARVLWLGLEGDTDRMASFRDDLQDGLEAFGIEKERRRFRPHLTLGRFRRPERIGPRLRDIISGYDSSGSPLCRLEELVQFKSDLKQSGAEYTKLNSWKLNPEIPFCSFE